jgi:hypothetical protein
MRLRLLAARAITGGPMTLEPPEPDEGQDPDGNDLHPVGFARVGTLPLASRNAEEVARAAEASTSHMPPGYCLVWSRTRALIDARYGTASIAWANAADRRYDRNPPRGAFAYWTGGSKGYGHIAVSLGGGLIRSTDADGAGSVATRHLDWFDTYWPSLTYVGWADNTNGVRVPGVIGDWFDMATQAELRAELAPLLTKLDTLTERTEGLRLTLAEITAGLSAIDLELDGLARSTQVAKAREQIRQLRLLVEAQAAG